MLTECFLLQFLFPDLIYQLPVSESTYKGSYIQNSDGRLIVRNIYLPAS